MRPYIKRVQEYKTPVTKLSLLDPKEFAQPSIEPGYRLTELIDQFFELGVTPDFPPADLGVDDASTEVDANGDPIVDPVSNIRVGRDMRRQMQLDAHIGVSSSFDEPTSDLPE